MFDGRGNPKCPLSVNAERASIRTGLKAPSTWEVTLLNVLAASTLLLALEVGMSIGSAQEISKSPQLNDYYSQPDGKFTLSSSVVVADANSQTYLLQYAICNFDPSEGLVFSWVKPGFGTGLFYPLPSGKCMDAQQYTNRYSPDYNAPVIFAQSNKMKQAGAYIASGSELKDGSVRLHGWYSQDAKMNEVELTIHYHTDSEGHLRYSIGWNQGARTFAISVDVPEGDMSQIAEQLEKSSGVKVTPEKLPAIIGDDEVNRLRERNGKSGPSLPTGTYLAFSLDESKAGSGVFATYNKPSGSPESIIVLASDKRLVADYVYSPER